MQSRSGSFVEATTNVCVGWLLNFILNLLVLPLFGFSVTVADAFGIGVIFTAVSLIRSYVLRRIFDAHEHSNLYPRRDPYRLRYHKSRHQRGVL